MPVITVKKKCCKSDPRCKRCPVTMNRLAKAGFSTKLSKKQYDVPGKIPKKIRKAARAS